MRLLYVITLAEKGGGQVHVADLLKAFAVQEEVHLAIGTEGYLTDVARGLGVTVHLVPHLCQPIQPVKDLFALRELLGIIRSIRPDLIHAHTSKAGLIARIAGRISKVPVIFTAHTWSFADGISRVQQLISTPLERFVGSWGDPIITVSEANRRMALEKRVAGAEQLITIWNGMPESAERWRPPGNQVPRIIMVARFAVQKDQELLVRAAAEIQDPYQIVFVGTGPTEATVRQVADSSGNREKIVFLGESHHVAKELAFSDIFVLAAKWEGLPLSILEAMRTALPVVASNVGGVSEAVIDGETGYLVERSNQEMLRDRLVRLLRSADLRRRLGEAGRQRYERHFTFDKMVSSTNTLYRKMLQPQGK